MNTNSKFKYKPTLQKETVALLRSRHGIVTMPEITRDTGLPQEWLYEFQRDRGNAMCNSIEMLNQYLKFRGVTIKKGAK